MPHVKRFRPLGQSSLKVSEQFCSEPCSKKESVSQASSFRKPRSDRKHQFPLRAALGLWSEIVNLNLNCQGSESGPSLNTTICSLLDLALSKEELVNSLLDQYPNRKEVVIVRSWDGEN